MKSEKILIIILSAGLLILVGICVAGYFLLRDPVFSKPEVMIFQPNKPLTINVSEGIMLIVEGRSGNNINYIEFRENGLLISREYPPVEGAEALLTYISWVPEKVGVYELSFVAYDQATKSSDPASITIGVISNGLSQEDVNETIEAVAEAEKINVALSAPSDEGNPPEDGSGAGGDNASGGDGGGQEDERPDQSDSPPKITVFEATLQRDGNTITASVDITAKDDRGIERIYLVAHSFQEAAEEWNLPCEGQPPICSVNISDALSHHAYIFTAVAKDTFGQPSAALQRFAEVAENPGVGELPAFAIERVVSEIPAEQMGVLARSDEAAQINPSIFENADLVLECPTSFEDVQIQMVPNKLDGQLIIPPCMETEYENPVLFAQIGEARESWSLNAGRYTQDMYENGAILDFVVPELFFCGIEKFQLYPALDAHYQTVLLGTPTEVTPPLCRPMSPSFLELRATEDCPTHNYDYCIKVKWNAISHDPNKLDVKEVILTQIIFTYYGANFQSEIRFPPNETTYINPFQEYDYVIEYRLHTVSAGGIQSAWEDKINMRIPVQDDFSEQVSYDWWEYR